MKVLINTKRLTVTRGKHSFAIYDKKHKHLGINIARKSFIAGVLTSLKNTVVLGGVNHG